MKNKFGLLVAIIGLVVFAACENEPAADQTQQEIIEQVQVQEVTPIMDTTAVDSTK